MELTIDFRDKKIAGKVTDVSALMIVALMLPGADTALANPENLKDFLQTNLAELDKQQLKDPGSWFEPAAYRLLTNMRTNLQMLSAFAINVSQIFPSLLEDEVIRFAGQMPIVDLSIEEIITLTLPVFQYLQQENDKVEAKTEKAKKPVAKAKGFAQKETGSTEAELKAKIEELQGLLQEKVTAEA